jgi:hypothetical protein
MVRVGGALGRLPTPRDVLASPLLLPAAAALLDGPPPSPLLPALPLPLAFCLALSCAPTPRAHHALSGSTPPKERRSRHLATRHPPVC